MVLDICKEIIQRSAELQKASKSKDHSFKLIKKPLWILIKNVIHLSIIVAAVIATLGFIIWYFLRKITADQVIEIVYNKTKQKIKNKSS